MKRVCLAVGLWRALGESILAAVGLFLPLLLLRGMLPLSVQARWLSYSVVACAVYFSCRMRLNTIEKGAVPLFKEVAAAFLFGLLFVALWLLGIFVLMPAPFLEVGLALAVLGSLPLILTIRGLARIMIWWNDLRRRYFVWALTHDHLRVMTFLALFFSLGCIIWLAFTTSYRLPVAGTGSEILSIVINFVPLLVFVLGGVLFAWLVVLLPAGIFSYLAARRTAKGITGMAQAVSALDEGEKAVGVPADGAAEIDSIITSFNRMVADLDRSALELKRIQVRVDGLLDIRHRLVAGVSQELHMPLTHLQRKLEALALGWKDIPPLMLTRELKAVAGEAAYLQTLVADLLTLAEAESNRLPLHLQETDLNALALDMVETMRPMAWAQARIEVVLDIEESLPPVQIDPARLEQVIRSLLYNALRQTVEGGIVVISIRAEEENLVIEVRDTGMGVDGEELPHIWDDLSQSGDKSLGTGLGLALVKEVVGAMGGAASVDSTVGEGSCFTVQLPLTHAAD